MSLLSEPLTASVARDVRDFTLLHRLGCKICPLAQIEENSHPDMAPTGAKNPVVYVLGEAPGRQEDLKGQQFVGQSGRLLRTHIPESLKKKIRYNNVVRTRPRGNQTPDRTAIECCRPSVTTDIEEAKPKAIFGFGNIPLEWLTGMSGGITLWRGRRLPVRVGSHTCWFYPMIHPAWLVRRQNSDYSRVYPDDPLQVSSEEERMFVLDLQRAFAEIDHLPKPEVHTAADARANIEIIPDTSNRGLRRVLDGLRWAAEQVGLGYDYETNCLRPYAEGSRILTVALGTDEHVVAFPLDHPSAPWSGTARQDIHEAMLDFLSAREVRRYVHNLAFDHEWTAVNFGPEYLRCGEWVDTATQACILDERTGKKKPGPLSLDWLVLQHFGLHLKDLSQLDLSNLTEAPVEVTLLYNGMDSKYHYLLGRAQERRIQEDGLEEAYALGYRRVPTVVLTQYKGIPVNQEEVLRLKLKYHRRLESIRKEIAGLDVVKEYRRRFHRTFNPGSPDHVLGILRDILDSRECKIWDKKSRTYKFSSKEEILDKIEHPIGELIIQFRKATRRKSTYVDPLEVGSPILYPDGLLHTQFNTIFAETGRLSSEAPNVQNFPKREEEAAEVRKPIAAALGELILSIDYGQIEARVIAMFTKDPVFVKALWERYDVHMEWAERIARAYPRRIGGRENLGDKQVMKSLRTDIKNQWTFPLFFGASVQAASGYLGIPEEDIRPLYDAFWDQFSGVRDWQERQLASYQEKGYVECLTGRRRRGPLTLNQVYNTPVQGTAAEIVMDAMCRLSELGDMTLQPEMNIHDDLTFLRIPERDFEDVLQKIIDEMLAVPFPWVNVPITVEISCGRNWLEMEEIGTVSSDEWFGDGRH